MAYRLLPSLPAQQSIPGDGGTTRIAGSIGHIRNQGITFMPRRLGRAGEVTDFGSNEAIALSRAGRSGAKRLRWNVASSGSRHFR